MVKKKRVKMRNALSILIITLFSFVSYSQVDKPNIVILLADDQGWGDISWNGNTNVSTPNIDRIAQEGASFNNFYVQ